jgi:hypothetical protein
MMAKNELEDAGSCGLCVVQGSVVYLPGGTGSVDVQAQVRNGRLQHTSETLVLETMFSGYLKHVVAKTGHHFFSHAFRKVYCVEVGC